jgi:hypothetical protein
MVLKINPTVKARTQMFQYQKYKRVRISKTVELKSGLEEVIYNYLKNNKVHFVYEGMKIKFELPTQKKSYTPDFPINDRFIVEAKGAFNSADRKKHKLIREQHPELDIRFIFSNSKTKIGKKSLTTYGKWCELFKFKFHCIQSTKIPFPQEWLNEIKAKKNGTR